MPLRALGLAFVAVLLTAAPAQAAGLTANPNPVDFGEVPAGSSKTLPVVVKNTDAASANVKITITAGTQFVLQGSPITCQLGPNETCSVNVRYTPSDQPVDNGTLHAADQIQLARKLDVPLTGRSGPPECPPTGPAPEECGKERFITVGDPLNETQQTETANWSFTIATDWDDIGCVDPPEGSPNPGAFVSIAPSVLDMGQTGLGSFLSMSEAVFTRDGVPKSFRLALGAKTITRDSRNGANKTLLRAAGDMLTNEDDFRPGNGLYYGGRLSCRVNEVAFDLVSTQPHVLCRNQKEGPGYSDLTQTMKDKLAELYTVLDQANVCYALASGNRSVAAQQQLRDDWHDIADMPDGDTRTPAEICAALTPRFIQCPTAWTAAGVARGGPAAPGNSRHNVGQAADLRLSFGALTGNFDPTTSQRKEDIRSHFTALVDQVDNLCESPSVDPGHIELPYKTADEVAPRCHFVDAARAFQRKKRRARRLPKGPAVAKAFAAANKFGRRFVGRNAEDIYLDWAVGRCKKGRHSTLCKLDILGEAAHQFTCHTKLVVTGSKRLRVDVLGRKTRCR